MRRAVIDLGTNTFHLLIADVAADGKLTEIYRERIFVKLAEEGITTIGALPFSRGIAALKHYRKRLDEYGIEDLKAIGTAALRTASNGSEFVTTALREASITIQLISGDEEANLITTGVLRAIPILDDQILIMDIGGGSTEYIIAGDAGVDWRQSFPIGVSVLSNDFHHSDPISADEILRLENHLAEQLAPLAAALVKHPAHHLIGAAGTFDVLAEALRDPTAPDHPTSHQLTLSGFPELYHTITSATLSERIALPEIPPERTDMIVVAMILLRFTFRLAEIRRITVSDYAMKEGVLVR
ncbi:MAG: exopolyphosphatase/guanosine-5'-triphosphate,3'-diphosphate pyrophosphatase [Neolewinella sp.]|jgi:exopolyphosphatase/guanosine-5'-triphosphate,3'-diphosphate pyrophosphatase